MGLGSFMLSELDGCMGWYGSYPLVDCYDYRAPAVLTNLLRPTKKHQLKTHTLPINTLHLEYKM